MTLEEYVERVKIENALNIDTEKIIEKITDEARKKKSNNVACLSDEEVKQIILKFSNESVTEEVVNVEQNKEKKQISLFDI